MKPPLQALLAAGLCWCLSTTAAAQTSPADLALAQDHFTKAREHQQRREWALCESSLRRAIKVFETPGLRFHFAFCKEQQHRWVEALVDYRRAGELLSQGVDAADVAELLPGAIAHLERVIPTLQLILEPAPPGSRLFVDGRELSPGLLGTAFTLDPGARKIRITAPGYVGYTQDINLVPEDRRSLVVRLVPQPQVPAAGSPAERKTQPPDQSRGAVSTALGIVLASEAVVALSGLGVGVGYSSYVASQELQQRKYQEQLAGTRCGEDTSTRDLCSQLADTEQNINQGKTLERAGYITAGAATLAFVVTWLVWPSANSERSGASSVSLFADAEQLHAGWSGTF